MSAPKTTTGFENAVFVGLESFLVDEELSRLKGSFKGDASMNWSVFNAEDDPTMDEIMSLCNTLPFFAERRVVIIRNGHKLSALQMDQVASYLEDPCDATTLILVLEGEKADRDLQKLLRKFDAGQRSRDSSHSGTGTIVSAGSWTGPRSTGRRWTRTRRCSSPT